MDNLHQLLQVSAKLYQHLTKPPVEVDRDDYIEKINAFLDERGQIINLLEQADFVFDNNDKSHVMLAELDKGISERLKNVMELVKSDLRELQNAKKNEKQYIDPYANVAVMDGRYYDKKN